MDWIDRYAYSNRLRFIHPGQKAGLALLAIILCLALNRPAVGVLTTGWMLMLGVIWARVPLRVLGAAVLVEGFLLAWAVVGVAVSVQPGSGGWPLSFAITSQSCATAFNLLTRALGCTSAMAFLAFTTPVVDLLDLGRMLGMPPLLLDLALLIYRFTFALLESLEHMVTAQQVRLGYADFRHGMNSAALVASRLFIETYQRTRRLQVALEGRGYAGDLRVLPGEYRRSWSVWLLAAALASSLLAAWGWV